MKFKLRRTIDEETLYSGSPCTLVRNFEVQLKTPVDVTTNKP